MNPIDETEFTLEDYNRAFGRASVSKLRILCGPVFEEDLLKCVKKYIKEYLKTNNDEQV